MKEKNIKVNAVLNMIKTISSIIFPLITFPYVSRVLMPENIGKVNFGSSFVSYFSLIASLGITTYAIRECSAKRDDKNELSKTASQIFSINVITTIIAYALMAITLLLFRNFDSYRTLIIIQSTAILFTTLGCDWLNSAMEDFTFITIRTIAFQFVSLVLLFIFIHEPSDYIKYAAITVVASSGANVINIFYRKRYCAVKFVKEMEWRKHFRPITLLFVMILAQTVFNSADITMLGLIKGDVEVGYYSTAVKITHLINQIISSILWVAMPQLSKLFMEEDFENINKILRKIFIGFISLGLPCAIGCICLSKEIVEIIGGQNYIDAALPLVILMIGFIFDLVGGAFLGNMILLPSKREDKYMKICVTSTILNVVLNYFLIPKWGAAGAASTTSIAYLIMLILCYIATDRRIKLKNIKNTVVSSVIGCLVIVFVCAAVKMTVHSLIISVIASVLCSALLYAFVQILFKNELVSEIIISIKKRLHT